LNRPVPAGMGMPMMMDSDTPAAHGRAARQRPCSRTGPAALARVMVGGWVLKW